MAQHTNQFNQNSIIVGLSMLPISEDKNHNLQHMILKENAIMFPLYSEFKITLYNGLSSGYGSACF